MLGIGAIWRTGNAISLVKYPDVGSRENEQVVAMIYLGRPAANLLPPPEVDPETFLRRL